MVNCVEVVLIDEQIVTGLKRRDKGAFELFWNNYYHRVYPICAFILGHGPDAVDMTVDILVDFVEKHADNLSTPRALFSFLRQMAVRRSIRMRDKRDKVTCLERDSQLGLEDETTPEQEAEMNQLMPLLSQCLEHMTPKTQMTLRMKYANKISNEEIGRVLGGSKSYIGRVLNNGRETLRKCIEKKAAEANLAVSAAHLWGSGLKPAFNLSAVDTLLSHRPHMDEGICTEMGKMVAASAHLQDAELAAWSEAHSAACAECRRAALVLQAVDSGSSAPESNIRNLKEPVLSRDRLRSIVPLAIAASISAVLLGFWLTRLSPEVPTQSDGLTVKGGGDVLHAAVRRGAAEFALHPLDELMTDDKIGLFYSTKQNGYLAVFSRDNGGEPSLIFPTSGTLSAKISAGHQVPLSDGAVVSPGTGCEWLAAVFSDGPLLLSEIAGELRSADTRESSAECGLKVVVPGARTIHILPVKR